MLSSQYGRLGNKLWTYANVLSYAMEFDLRVVNPSFDTMASVFSNTYNNYFQNKIASVTSRINNKAHLFPSVVLENGQLLSLDQIESVNLITKKLIFFHGLYFYAPKCLENNKEKIRHLFTPSNTIISRVKAIIAKAKSKSDIIIGVHIRQGDYKTHSNGIMYYSLDEYIKVMRCLKEQFQDKKVSFIICSDEYQNLSSYKDLNLIPANGGVVEDLYTLAHCDFIFGPNSTFSHWASFWGKVPLHILNYRAESICGSNPVYLPQINAHFKQFDPNDFGKFARAHITLKEAIR
ncbi:alpha-1,2-fucosyltransferase [Synechocystis salina LEGE 06099]|uniref:alpha-1,2-fucosyltransferase n=1 Tax=Synechocystis salina TaxID=945780 RepID=UPI00187E3635|nr:alpha-1,2-fucosyltransferase [Synechocystis salina]MBE9203864.1 alpha-1,2-fucosyltransferase [Synechocystis salina LEGE 06099]